MSSSSLAITHYFGIYHSSPTPFRARKKARMKLSLLIMMTKMLVTVDISGEYSSEGGDDYIEGQWFVVDRGTERDALSRAILILNGSSKPDFHLPLFYETYMLIASSCIDSAYSSLKIGW